MDLSVRIGTLTLKNPLIAAIIMPLSGLVTLAVVAAHFQFRQTP